MKDLIKYLLGVSLLLLLTIMFSYMIEAAHGGGPRNMGIERAPGFALGPANSDSVQVMKNDKVIAVFYPPWEDEVLYKLPDGSKLLAKETLEFDDMAAFYRLSESEVLIGFIDPRARETKGPAAYYFKFFESTGDENVVTAGRIITDPKGELLFDRYGVKKN